MDKTMPLWAFFLAALVAVLIAKAIVLNVSWGADQF